MRIGYARVSSADQNSARQEVALKDAEAEMIFIDKCSGKNMNRPQLQAMINYIRKGDTLIVTEYARLARSTHDLLELIDTIKGKGVEIVSLKENFDTSTADGEFILTVFAGLSQLEREIIRERQREGIEIAKAEGKYRGRQPIPYDENELRKECKKWREGKQTAVQTYKKLKMKPNRFYRLVNKLGL